MASLSFSTPKMFDTSKRYDGYFCRTASDIDNHVSERFEHVYADTHSCCHRLVYHTYFFGACLLSSFTHSSLFHVGDT